MSVDIKNVVFEHIISSILRLFEAYIINTLVLLYKGFLSRRIYSHQDLAV